MHTQPHTAESRKRISEQTRLAMARPEVYKRLSEIRRNRNQPPNAIPSKVCEVCLTSYERPIGSGWKPWEKRKYCSVKCQGIAFGYSQTGEKNHRFGTKITEEHKRAIGNANSGKNHHHWKGGISRIKQGNTENCKWRIKVFQRDDWTCQGCKERACYLEAHHIKSWAKYPELRYELSNGLTLCLECHKLTNNYKGKVTKISTL